MTKNRILGVVGIVWGGAIVLGRLTGAPPPTVDAAYAAGQNVALALGTLLAAAGLYYAVKG